MNITIETTVHATVDKVWRAYTSPEDIIQWNAASDDWHTTSSSVELRVGGTFSSRMEAKDGSFGFDFAGTYTKIIPNELIEYIFDDRSASVEFINVNAAELVAEAVLVLINRQSLTTPAQLYEAVACVDNTSPPIKILFVIIGPIRSDGTPTVKP